MTGAHIRWKVLDSRRLNNTRNLFAYFDEDMRTIYVAGNSDFIEQTLVQMYSELYKGKATLFLDKIPADLPQRAQRIASDFLDRFYPEQQRNPKILERMFGWRNQ